MVTDPISDMFARIRNAATAHLQKTDIPLSRLKKQVAQILKNEGYISDFQVESEAPSKLTVFLKYGRNQASAIAGIRRASRPGRRIYVGHRDIPIVHNGMGIAILSTSKGILTDRDARRQHLGGEILGEVW